MKKKGVFLIYVLFTAVLISVFLITAVSDMHNSFFLTKKFTGENKAYWAAEAGMQYCEYKLKSDLGWPFFNAKNNNNNNIGTEKFGKFTIISSGDGDNGYYVHGKSDKEAEEFHIYFSKKQTPKGNGLISIVPESFPSDKLSYCSYTSMKKDDLHRTTNDERDINYSNSNFIVSTYPEHQAIITSPGIYIISDGRSGIYRAVLEKMYVVDSNNKFGGGLYSGGNINIDIKGQKSNFRVSQTSNSQPEVYCKKNMNLIRDNPNNEIKNDSFIQPCSIYGGTIYLGKQFRILDPINDSYNKSIDFEDDKNEDLFEKYQDFKKDGVNLDQYTSSNDISFPKLSWGKITDIKNRTIQDDEKNQIPSGTYVAIFEQDYDSYSLFRLNKDYTDENGKFKSKDFDADMEIAKRMVLEQIKDVRSENTVDPKPYKTRKGKWVDPKPYLTQQGIAEISALNSERGVILSLVSYLNGSEKITLKNDGKEVILGTTQGDTGIIASETTESDLFAIKTVGIENKDQEEKKKKEDDGKPVSKWKGTPTPIITLKDSVETTPIKIKNDGDSEKKNFFNLITLVGNVSIEKKTTTYKDENDVSQTKCETTINNIDFHIAKDTPTDLVFNKKNDGVSERKTMLEYTGEEQQYSGLVSGEDSVMLYSKGNVLINGKLSGNGQILSGENVYFKAGAQLNAKKGKDLKKNDDDGKLNSKIGIYSRGKVTMQEPDSIGSFDELHNSIKNSLEKLQGKEYEYYNFIVDTILEENVPVTKEAKSKIDSRLADKAPKSTSLKKLMKDYYGFSERESRDYLEEVVSKNLIYNHQNDRYKLAKDLKITSKNPSSFSGVIYSCGGFECNAGNNDVTINGILCTYGASNPDTDEPGSGVGFEFGSKKCLSGNPGGIEIKKCNNFSVVYNSTDLSDFLEICSGEKLPINLTCIYCNRL